MAKRTAPKPLILRGELPLEFELHEVSGEWRLEEETLHWKEQAEVSGPWPRGENALDLRQQFLSIERDDARALLDFLNRTGSWDGRTKYGLYEFWGDQNTIRRLLTRNPPPGHWFEVENFFENFLHELTLNHVVWQGKRLVASYSLTETREALLLSAWLDFARGAKFRYCARPDCPKHRKNTVPYELTSRHRRRYCSQYCAHLESKRRVRAKAKKKRAGARVTV